MDVVKKVTSSNDGAFVKGGVSSDKPLNVNQSSIESSPEKSDSKADNLSQDVLGSFFVQVQNLEDITSRLSFLARDVYSQIKK